MDSSQSLTNQDRGEGALALILVSTVVSTSVVLLRVYSKCFVIRGMGWDDGVMVVAMIFSNIYEAFNIVNIRYGDGRHRRFLNDYQVNRTAKWGFISGLFYNLTIFFVKFSVILFLLRIGKLKRWVRIVIYLDFFLVFGSLVTAIIVQLVQCIPIAYNWNSTIGGHCLPSRTLTLVSYISSAFTTLTDFVCVILPFFILWDLKISRKAKIWIWILLCFGMFPGVCSFVKIFYLRTLGTEDSTWSAIPLANWGVAEIHSGIVAASIPSLRPLFLRLAARLRGNAKLQLPASSYELRNRYRYRVRNPDQDDDERRDVFSLHERSDAGNQDGIVKTTEVEVTNTINPGAKVRPQNTSEGSGQFVNSACGRD